MPLSPKTDCIAIDTSEGGEKGSNTEKNLNTGTASQSRVNTFDHESEFCNRDFSVRHNDECAPGHEELQELHEVHDAQETSISAIDVNDKKRLNAKAISRSCANAPDHEVVYDRDFSAIANRSAAEHESHRGAAVQATANREECAHEHGRNRDFSARNNDRRHAHECESHQGGAYATTNREESNVRERSRVDDVISSAAHTMVSIVREVPNLVGFVVIAGFCQQQPSERQENRSAMGHDSSFENNAFPTARSSSYRNGTRRDSEVINHQSSSTSAPSTRVENSSRANVRLRMFVDASVQTELDIQAELDRLDREGDSDNEIIRIIR